MYFEYRDLNSENITNCKLLFNVHNVLLIHYSTKLTKRKRLSDLLKLVQTLASF